MTDEQEAAADICVCIAFEQSELANVWAAVLTLCLFIACTVTLGFWLIKYHEEAETLREFAVEPTSALQLILDDCTFCR